MGNTEGSTNANFCNFANDEKDAYVLGLWLAEKNLPQLTVENIIKAYFAGRFDGDGSMAKNFRNDCRIVYTKKVEAVVDKNLLHKIGILETKVYHYKTANTFCLYVSRYVANNFLNNIAPYSLKLQKLAFVPCRDLALS